MNRTNWKFQPSSEKRLNKFYNNENYVVTYVVFCFQAYAIMRPYAERHFEEDQMSTTIRTRNLVLVKHPLAHDALRILRDQRTGPEDFRRAAKRISLILVAESFRDFESTEVTVRTPLATAEAELIEDDAVVVVPVLRAGMGMLEAVHELIPQACVGHVGLQRDEETAVASQYYSPKLPPDIARRSVILTDPMLATGGSAVAAVDVLKTAGAKHIRMICIVAAQAGIDLMEEKHPDVDIYTPVVDAVLNDKKYIVPGLGDFGDRLYGTCW